MPIALSTAVKQHQIPIVWILSVWPEPICSHWIWIRAIRLKFDLKPQKVLSVWRSKSRTEHCCTQATSKEWQILQWIFPRAVRIPFVRRHTTQKVWFIFNRKIIHKNRNMPYAVPTIQEETNWKSYMKKINWHLKSCGSWFTVSCNLLKIRWAK